MTARLFVTVTLLLAVSAEAAETVQSAMQAANEALSKKDYPAYLQHMKEAVELEPDRVSRPYVQYALARAYAYNGKAAESFDVLERIWKEQIEGPMIFIAEQDPAFAKVRTDPRFQAIQNYRKKTPIRFSQVSESIWEIEGAGCRLAISSGNDGVLLVDSGYPQVASVLKQAMEKQTGGKPLKFIINTHEHLDHVGGNDALGGNPVVIAFTGARPALQKSSEFFSDFSLPPLPESIWPDLTFQEKLTIHFNGEAVTVLALPAHSEGDAIVYFNQSKVLHMGDNYFPESPLLYPGQSIKPYFETFGPFLESLSDDVTVLSGHTAPVKLATLRETYNKTKRLYLLVEQRIGEKKSFEEIKSEAEKEGYPERWIRFYYQRLSPKES